MKKTHAYNIKLYLVKGEDWRRSLQIPKSYLTKSPCTVGRWGGYFDRTTLFRQL